MSKFLVIAQDLRISGTSEGIVSRSFLAKLRMAYPNAIIDVVYLKKHPSDDQLHLLPVDSIKEHVLNLKIPFFTKFINRFYWRIFHVSLVVKFKSSVYASYITNIDHNKYDHVFIRSSGLYHETILGAKDLPILKRAIVNFHDPYPLFWYVGSQSKLTNLEMFKMKEMLTVVSQSKTCMSSANNMSNDLEYLYGTRKKFYTLPHQYSESVFDLSDTSKVLQKNKKITISYHGAIQFGRNIEILLDAYQELVKSNPVYKEDTEFVLRMKGIDLKKIEAKYAETPNIVVLETLNFSNSCYEQQHIADINIILENGPIYCNILVGKAPFLASCGKPILSISPKRSELRKIINDEKYIADCENKTEIKQKLENLIINRLNTTEKVSPFGDYFSQENFKIMLDSVLFCS
jgi:glycosyltransferase involved in cell wall biosynthesis